MEAGNIFTAFLLTLAAGLAMGIGSLLSFTGKKGNNNFLAASLGFACGVMIYTSFVEILPEAKETLAEIFGEEKGILFAVGSFLWFLQRSFVWKIKRKNMMTAVIHAIKILFTEWEL